MCESGAIANGASPASKKEINIACHYPHLPISFDFKEISKLEIRG
jgi:hypothetical protein